MLELFCLAVWILIIWGVSSLIGVVPVLLIVIIVILLAQS